MLSHLAVHILVGPEKVSQKGVWRKGAAEMVVLWRPLRSTVNGQAHKRDRREFVVLMICSEDYLLASAVREDTFCAKELPLLSLSQPRFVVYNLETNRHLVLDLGVSSNRLLDDKDGGGIYDGFFALATQQDLNHGFGVHGGYIYTFSDTTILVGNLTEPLRIFRAPLHLWLTASSPMVRVGLLEVT